MPPRCDPFCEGVLHSSVRVASSRRTTDKFTVMVDSAKIEEKSTPGYLWGSYVTKELVPCKKLVNVQREINQPVKRWVDETVKVPKLREVTESYVDKEVTKSEINVVKQVKAPRKPTGYFMPQVRTYLRQVPMCS